MQKVGGRGQILFRNRYLRLHAAQLDVIARHFRQRRDPRVAQLPFGGFRLRIGRFDLAPNAAPDIDFPGGVETRLIDIDGRHYERMVRFQRQEGLSGQAHNAVLAI